MKKNYEDPQFEVAKFSFEDTLSDNMTPSNPEATIGTDGGAMPDEDEDFDW